MKTYKSTNDLIAATLKSQHRYSTTNAKGIVINYIDGWSPVIRKRVSVMSLDDKVVSVAVIE